MRLMRTPANPGRGSDSEPVERIGLPSIDFSLGRARYGFRLRIDGRQFPTGQSRVIERDLGHAKYRVRMVVSEIVVILSRAITRIRIPIVPHQFTVGCAEPAAAIVDGDLARWRGQP